MLKFLPLVALITGSSLHAEEQINENKPLLDFKQSYLLAQLPRVNAENATIGSITQRIQCMSYENSLTEIYFHVCPKLKEKEAFKQAKFTFDKGPVTMGEVMKVLQDQTGILYEVRQTVVLYGIGEIKWRVPKPPANFKIEKKFKKINLPSIKFQNASIQDVRSTLQKASRENDPNPLAHKKGFPFAYGHPLVHDRKWGDIKFTFNKKKTNVIEVMEAFKKQTGLQYAILPAIVIYGIDPTKVKKNIK